MADFGKIKFIDMLKLANVIKAIIVGIKILSRLTTLVINKLTSDVITNVKRSRIPFVLIKKANAENIPIKKA